MKSPRYCLLIFFFLSLAPTCLHTQATPVSSLFLSEPHHDARVEALMVPSFRHWDNGYLVTRRTLFASPTIPVVVLYDRNGQIAREVTVWFNDAVRVSVTDAAAAPSGKVVVSGGMSNAAGIISNFVAEIDATGHVGRVVQTFPFSPFHVCAAEDGTVWAYGVDRDPNAQLRSVRKTFLLRQYGFGKGQLQAVLDRSSLNYLDWEAVDGRYPGDISLLCNSQKVALFNWTSQEWIEFDLQTSTLKTVKVTPVSNRPTAPAYRNQPPYMITGSAMTGSGEVFASVSDITRPVPPQQGIYKLTFDNAGGATWVPLAGSFGGPGIGARLLGVDGTDLVHTRNAENGMVLWSNVGAR